MKLYEPISLFIFVAFLIGGFAVHAVEESHEKHNTHFHKPAVVSVEKAPAAKVEKTKPVVCEK